MLCVSELQRGMVGKMGSEIGQILLLGVLGLGTYWDWKEKQIYLYLPIFAGIVGIILHLVLGEHTWMDIALGMAIGIVVLVISWTSRESIGTGDGMMLIASGAFLGGWGNLELLMIALLLVGVTALFLIVAKRKGRKDRLPFIPFLLVAYLFLL